MKRYYMFTVHEHIGNSISTCGSITDVQNIKHLSNSLKARLNLPRNKRWDGLVSCEHGVPDFFLEFKVISGKCVCRGQRIGGKREDQHQKR